MNTLFLNLTRLGDLIQNAPAVAGLAARGHSVGLVSLENFAPVAALMPGLSTLFALPGAKILAELDRDWRKAAGLVHDFRNAVQAVFPPDLIVNLTAQTPARLLTRVLAPNSGRADGLAELSGYILDEDGFAVQTSPWARHLLGATALRGLSPFNVVDLFWKTSGLPDVPRTLDLKRPEGAVLDRIGQRLTEKAVAAGFPVKSSKAPYVAFQLGASEPGRQWPAERFAELGRRVRVELGLHPVLLGQKSETPLALDYFAAGGPGITLVGETDLPELAAALLHCQALVTNDTGTMHLAAGLGLPIAAIFLATAQPFDTGPYRVGSVSLEPDMACHPCDFGESCPHGRACLLAVAAGDFFEALRTALDPAWTGRFTTSRAWRSKIGPAGFMSLDSLSGHETQDRTRFLQAQAAIYRRFLDDAPLDLATDVAFLEEFGEFRLTETARAAAAATTHEAGALFTLLSGRLKALAASPNPAMRQKFLGLWQRIAAVYDASPWFAVLGYLWRDAQQTHGGDFGSIEKAISRFGGLNAVWTRVLALDSNMPA